MHSLKNLSRLSLAIVFISITIAIIANFTFLQQMRTFISQSADSIEKSRNDLYEMEIAIRVLNNITGVILRDGEASLSEGQIVAFQNNQLKLEKATTTFSQLLSELDITYSEIDKWSFRRHDKIIGKLNQAIEKIQHDVDNHGTEYSQMASTMA